MWGIDSEVQDRRQGGLEANVIRQIEIDLGLRNREIREIFRK